MLYRPETFEIASAYEGTELEYHLGGEGWVAAVISCVPVPPCLGRPCDGLRLRITVTSKEDGGTRQIDLEWDDIEDSSKCNLLTLPDAAIEDQMKQRKKFADKGKAVANGRRQSDARQHLLRANPPAECRNGQCCGEERLSEAHLEDELPSGASNGGPAQPSSAADITAGRPKKRQRFDAQTASQKLWNFEQSAPGRKQHEQAANDEPEEEEEMNAAEVVEKAATCSKPSHHPTSPDSRGTRKRVFSENEDGVITERARKQQRQAVSRPTFVIEGQDLGDFELVQPGGAVGNTGQVLKLELINFMNHDHLVVDFEPHLNFICGENGSGKTAILHALQTTLGVAVKKTSRTANAAGCIKDGCAYSKTSAIIWNTGEDAVMPRKYGHQLTIQRSMRRSARNVVTSTWSILDAHGREVGNKKSHVTQLLKEIGVNAANPIVCLTQDTAKGFAGANASAELYKTYMEATQFDEILENSNAASQEISGMRDNSNAIKKQLKEKKEELHACKTKLEYLEEVTPLKELQQKVDKVAAWETVWEQEDNADSSNNVIENIAPKRDAELAEYEAFAREQYNQVKDDRDAKRREAQEQPQKIAGLAAECVGLKGQLQQSKAATVKLKGQVKKLERERDSKHQEVKNIREVIEDLSNRDDSAAAKEAQKLVTQLDESMIEAEAASCAVTQARQEQGVASAAERDAQQEIRDKESDAQEANNRMRGLQNELQHFQAQQRGNRIIRFASRANQRHIERFVNSVSSAAQQGRFHRRPLGPVGSLLSLVDEKWGRAVERAIGGCFNNFIVHDHHDSQVLREIARSIPGFQLPNMTILSFDHPPHDLNRGRTPQVPPHLLTIFRVLKFEAVHYPHVLSNFILDQVSAERFLLVDTTHDALQAIRGPLGKAQIISSAWAMDNSYATRQRGNETHFPVDPKAPSRLCRSVTADIERCQREVRDQQALIFERNAAVMEARRAFQQAQKRTQKAAQTLQARQNTKVVKDATVDDIRTQQESLAAEDSSSLEGLGASLATATREADDLQKKVEAETSKLEEAIARDEGAVSAIKRKEAEAKALEDAVTSLYQLAQGLEVEIQEKESRIKELAEIRVEFQKKLDAVRVQKKAALDMAKSLKDTAIKICEEEEAKLLDDALQVEFEKEYQRQSRSLSNRHQLCKKDVLAAWVVDMQKKIESRERNAGHSLIQLQDKVDSLERQVEKRRREARNVGAHCAAFEAAHRERVASIKSLEDKTLENVQQAFNRYLHKRGFTGKVDSTDERMVFKVRMGDSRSAVKDVRTLSGGERSYLNLCFILSVGDTISCPFHCMDEFDVFMDAINRRVSLQMLLTFGVENPQLQMILLSPLGAHMIEDAEAVVERESTEFRKYSNLVHKMQMHPPRD